MTHFGESCETTSSGRINPHWNFSLSSEYVTYAYSIIIECTVVTKINITHFNVCLNSMLFNLNTLLIESIDTIIPP